MKYDIATVSLIGGRKENQDAFRYAEISFGLLAVVCDGMGGARGGKEAAELSIDKVFSEISRHTKGNPIELINKAIEKANHSIYRESLKNPMLFGMGTTITALLITEENAYSFHVGDSRIYQVRQGEILFRTFDHSRVFEMVHLGLLTEEEARVSPMSNVITKVLGTEAALEVTCSAALQQKKGDRFLLCTDGIWGALPENELIRIVSGNAPVVESLNKLTLYIGNLGGKNGVKLDNMTAVLIETL